MEGQKSKAKKQAAERKQRQRQRKSQRILQQASDESFAPAECPIENEGPPKEDYQQEENEATREDAEEEDYEEGGNGAADLPLQEEDAEKHPSQTDQGSVILGISETPTSEGNLIEEYPEQPEMLGNDSPSEDDEPDDGQHLQAGRGASIHRHAGGDSLATCVAPIRSSNHQGNCNKSPDYWPLEKHRPLRIL